MLLCIFSVSVYGQFNTVDNPDNWKWEKHPGPVLENGDPGSWESEGVGFPTVLLLNNVYHMWYGGIAETALEIGHATSDDGINWIKDPENPVLEKGESGSWDDVRVYIPEVVHDGNKFHMWYVGAGTDEYPGYATSEDGSNWTKIEGKPTIELNGEPFQQRVSIPAVIYDGQLFHMWSHSSGLSDIYYATSANGSDWTISPESPVMVGGGPGEWDNPRMQISSAFLIGDTIHLCYAGGGFYTWRTGYATSPDGITWIKDTHNPVLNYGGLEEWDQMYVAFGSLMYDESENTLKMWYYGGDELLKGDIGYAEFVNTTGINNSTYDQGLLIYPNPAMDILHLHMANYGEKSYTITSISGQLVQNGFMSENDSQIDISQLPGGMYFVTLRSNQRTMTAKLMIE